MAKTTKNRSRNNDIGMMRMIVIVGAALLMQMIGSYYADRLMIGKYFFLSWVILRIIIPVIVILLLGIPLSSLGLALPTFTRNTWMALLIAVTVFAMAFTGLYFLKDYFGYYSGVFDDPGGGRLGRVINFGLFTASTLTGWEFLHRAFLLMGVRYVLAEREGIRDDTAWVIAIAFVWIFETVFHFVKPDIEALGMFIGSPFLSWLALRTRSIWPSFTLHLCIEALFIAALILQ